MADATALTALGTAIDGLIIGTVVPPLLWTVPVAYTATLTVQYWQMGYMYAGSLDAYKTACLGIAGCDWLKWNGYDGMLFVVVFNNKVSPLPTLGWYAICFPNPVSSAAPKFSTGTGTATAVVNPNGNFITQTCLGVAYTTTIASAAAASRWIGVSATMQPFYFINDPTAATTIANCVPSGTLTGCNTAAVPNTTTISNALYDDCVKLLGPSNDGHWNNGVTAISLTNQSPFCWNKWSSGATFPAVTAAQFYAWTFIPTTLAVKLTSTSNKQLLATAAGYNAVSTWSNVAAAVLGVTTPAAALVTVSGTITIGANTPAFQTAVVYPSATVAGASALTMSLAAATVMATLF